MGYGGKLVEQQRARELRADAWTLQDIASELGVSKSSVSLWVRDVEFSPAPNARSPVDDATTLRTCASWPRSIAIDGEGVDESGSCPTGSSWCSELALYAGEGAKTRRRGRFANSDPT